MAGWWVEGIWSLSHTKRTRVSLPLFGDGGSERAVQMIFPSATSFSFSYIGYLAQQPPKRLVTLTVVVKCRKLGTLEYETIDWDAGWMLCGISHYRKLP